jgi:DNA-directed RNA polymerase subunit omega
MARITVEDCLDHIDNRNRFHLSLLASRRARQLREGAFPLVQSEEDDYTVLALREIATGQVTTDFLDRIDRELGGTQQAGGGEPSAESVTEAAEALGAGMASGVPEAAAPEGEQGAPEEPAGEAPASGEPEEGGQEEGDSGPAEGEES